MVVVAVVAVVSITLLFISGSSAGSRIAWDQGYVSRS
jgi:hypothetical protein